MTVMPLLMLILFQPGHHWVIRQQFSPEGGLYLFVSTDTGAPNPSGVHTLRAEMCLFERSGRWQQNLFRNVELQLGLKKLNESDSKIQDFTGVRRWRSVISFGKSTITNEQRGWCSYSNSSCGLKGQFSQIRQRNPSCTSLKASSHPPGFSVPWFWETLSLIQIIINQFLLLKAPKNVMLKFSTETRITISRINHLGFGKDRV